MEQNENLYPKAVQELPICAHLDAICGELKASPSRFLVLTAATGAGKSTALPLALLRHFKGGILMLEPRRLAVLNIALRVAELLGEQPGHTVGYHVHLERMVSESTRFTVLTEAMLTRRLQSDPLLEGVSVVVIDEFHERSLHADTALAFLKESMQLREDLFVVVMSATMETQKLALYLGTGTQPAPIYSVPGRLFPVDVEYEPNLTPSKAVMRELMRSGAEKGAILVFLPGIAEIRRTQSELQTLGAQNFAKILVLHSSVPLSEQKKVLSVPKSAPKSVPKNGDSLLRRVILSSAIAETSLTVPDVTVVIDSGKSRMNVYNQNVGMDTLVTVPVSRFNAEQRAGRAGRIQKGLCVRLWREHDVLELSEMPEILRIDLADLLLNCAEWGIRGADVYSLSWFDPPPQGAMSAARELLVLLGCLSAEGAASPLGKAALSLGTSVRVACVALSGLFHNSLDFSTSLAARYSGIPAENKTLQQRQALELKKRCQKFEGNAQLTACFPQGFEKFSTVFALLCGYPDRLAEKCPVQDCEKGSLYLFPTGRKALLPELLPQQCPRFLVAPEVDAGGSLGLIRSWETVQDSVALNFMESRAEAKISVEFADESSAKLRKVERLCYGKIILKEKMVPVTGADYMQAVATKVADKGLDWLPLGNHTKNLLLRCQFYIQQTISDPKGVPFRQKFESLSKTVSEWLTPFVPQGSRVNEQAVGSALDYHLDAQWLSTFVPEELCLPNGKKRRLCYEVHNGRITPSVEIIIQQAFGCFKTPRIMGEPVLFKLLSPARRPLQITSDLENFWKETWPQICSEMKGRYPKHNWDYRKPTED